MRITRLLLFTLGLILVSGCDILSFSGELGQRTPAKLLANILFVEASIDGNAGPYLAVDTGSPVVAIAPDNLPMPPSQSAAEVGELGVFGLTFFDVPIVAQPFFTGRAGDLRTSAEGRAEPSAASALRVPAAVRRIGGVAGCTL